MSEVHFAGSKFLGGAAGGGNARLWKQSAAKDEYGQGSTAIRSRDPISKDTVEVCRVPVNSQQISRERYEIQLSTPEPALT